MCTADLDWNGSCWHQEGYNIKMWGGHSARFCGRLSSPHWGQLTQQFSERNAFAKQGVEPHTLGADEFAIYTCIFLCAKISVFSVETAFSE